ncbi:MAG: dephospho-CoA kinase [Proteobacteria bacterium]|nr:dephospho-CoA kinase [Pseudomonadota bacterium]
MILVGITGIIGSGKTTVSSMLKKEGFEVIDLDGIAKEVLSLEDVKKEIGNVFGTEYISGDHVNIEKMRSAAFQNRDSLKKLEKIVHPGIVERLFRNAEQIKKSGAKSVIIDGPLLFETGLYKKMDRTVVVSTDAEMLTVRLKNRGMDEEDVKRRMAFQMPLKEKERTADWVVHNNGTVEDLKKETAMLLEKIKGWEVEPHAS